MIIYSAMPLELILEGIEQEPHYTEVVVNGLTMVVEPVSATQYRVVRLISPNPNDYLNPNYMPGRIIHFRPVGS